MRQAKTEGGLLLEIRGDSTQVEAVQSEISRTEWADIEVKTLQQKSLLEIRDVDRWSTAEEGLDAVAIAGGVTHLGCPKAFEH